MNEKVVEHSPIEGGENIPFRDQGFELIHAGCWYHPTRHRLLVQEYLFESGLVIPPFLFFSGRDIEDVVDLNLADIGDEPEAIIEEAFHGVCRGSTASKIYSVSGGYELPVSDRKTAFAIACLIIDILDAKAMRELVSLDRGHTDQRLVYQEGSSYSEYPFSDRGGSDQDDDEGESGDPLNTLIKILLVAFFFLLAIALIF